jgi:hypothetical protein
MQRENASISEFVDGTLIDPDDGLVSVVVEPSCATPLSVGLPHAANKRETMVMVKSTDTVRRDGNQWHRCSPLCAITNFVT